MRALIDAYGAAVAARVSAVHVAISAGLSGTNPPLLVEAKQREAEAREALDGAIARATDLVATAIPDIEAIDAAAPQIYADDPRWQGRRVNTDRGYNASRKFTLKDARPLARHAALRLREAWDTLDPTLQPFNGG